MSSIHAGLVEYLNGLIGITRLVGNRIHSAASPASAIYPRITYQRIGSQHEHHMTAAAGLAKATFQINVFDTDNVSCNTVAEAVRAALQGYPTGNKWGPYGQFRIEGVFLKGQIDTYLPPTSNNETGRYMIAMDFDINYTESVPTFA